MTLTKDQILKHLLTKIPTQTHHLNSREKLDKDKVYKTGPAVHSVMEGRKRKIVHVMDVFQILKTLTPAGRRSWVNQRRRAQSWFVGRMVPETPGLNPQILSSSLCCCSSSATDTIQNHTKSSPTFPAGRLTVFKMIWLWNVWVCFPERLCLYNWKITK